MIAVIGLTPELVGWLLVLIGSVTLCGLYSGLEMGIYVINKIRLDLQAQARKRGAENLRRQLEKPENLLAVLLIGTNLSTYGATFAVSAMFVLAGLERYAELYTIAALTPVLFIFGDSVPKSVFTVQAETLVYRLGWLLKISSVVFNVLGLAPLVRGLAWLIVRVSSQPAKATGQHRIAAMVIEGAAGGAITQFQSTMAHRVINITQVTLAEVMVEMGSAITAPLEVTREQLIGIITEHDYRRLPLLDADGKVTGIVDIYDVLAHDEIFENEPRKHSAEPLILPESMAVTDGLYQMQSRHEAMAIIADHAERHVGIVTVKDLIEQIVGELEDL